MAAVGSGTPRPRKPQVTAAILEGIAGMAGHMLGKVVYGRTPAEVRKMEDAQAWAYRMGEWRATRRPNEGKGAVPDLPGRDVVAETLAGPLAGLAALKEGARRAGVAL